MYRTLTMPLRWLVLGLLFLQVEAFYSPGKHNHPSNRLSP
jgi:transmembrane 9 superfamily protein 2/4